MRPGGPLATLLKYELLQVMRDRRTVLIAVVAPLVLFPLLLLLARWSDERRERALESTVYRYAVEGPAADRGRELVDRAVALDSEDEGPPVHLEERVVADADSALAEGELHLVVHVSRPDTLGVPLLRLDYRASSDLSRTAVETVERRLRRIREAEREELLLERGFPGPLDRVGFVELRNLATPAQEGGALLATVLTPALVLLMLGGGAVVAADALCGEKERGTLETLLATAASRRDIVSAKLLAIVAVGLVVTVVNVVNLLAYVVFGLIELPADLAIELPAGVLLLLFALYVPVAFLLGALLLLLSGFAKSYKEYQIYAIPATFVLVIPSLAAALPGIDLRSVVAAVPLAGVSVAVREVVVGEYDWVFLALAFASTAGAAWWLAATAVGFLSRERLVAPSDFDAADLTGGEPLFRRHVLRWFGVLWVLLLVSSLWFVEHLGLRGQVVLNLVVLFLGASLVMIRRYGLPVKEALALRAPPAAAWPAVLVGAPSALLTGLGLSRLVEVVLPVPDRVVEAFGQYLAPGSMPLWEMLLLLAVLPAICEEIAFRGVLLYGLRKKLRPVRLAVAVGAIFGVFHVDLFRIVPTAWLGVVLTASVLLTGSLLPAVAWHGLNNAIALVATRMELPLEEAPAWMMAAGVVGLAVSGWILWRFRRPYPGLRPDAEGVGPSGSEPSGRAASARRTPSRGGRDRG